MNNNKMKVQPQKRINNKMKIRVEMMRVFQKNKSKMKIKKVQHNKRRQNKMKVRKEMELVKKNSVKGQLILAFLMEVLMLL